MFSEMYEGGLKRKKPSGLDRAVKFARTKVIKSQLRSLTLNYMKLYSSW